MENDKNSPDLSIITMWAAIGLCIFQSLISIFVGSTFSGIYETLGGEIPITTKMALSGHYIFGILALFVIIKEKLIKKKSVTLAINIIVSAISFYGIGFLIWAMLLPMFKIQQLIKQ